MENRINRKTFGELKEGDTIYSLTHHQATIQIFKQTVTSVKECVKGVSVEIRFGRNVRICQCINETRYYESGYFWKYAVTTTLEEAKEICKEMTEKKIKEHKKAIEAAKQKIKKWEQFKSQLDNDIYIIK